MDVMLARSAGFCYGVKRAVDMARETARQGRTCVMLGSIIHNANVVAELEVRTRRWGWPLMWRAPRRRSWR